MGFNKIKIAFFCVYAHVCRCTSQHVYISISTRPKTSGVISQELTMLVVETRSPTGTQGSPFLMQLARKLGSHLVSVSPAHGL